MIEKNGMENEAENEFDNNNAIGVGKICGSKRLS